MSVWLWMISQPSFSYSNRLRTFTPTCPERMKRCQQFESVLRAGWMAASHPPHRKHVHRHKTGKRTTTRTCSVWTLSEAWLAAVCLKSLPGVHSQPWSQEEGWEGETKRVNTRLMWAKYIHLHLEKGKQDAKQEGSSYWSARRHPSSSLTI